MRAYLISMMLAGQILAGADADGWPTIPDPVGLGHRLITIEYLKDHGVSVPPNASDATIQAMFRGAETGKLRGPDILTARIEQLESEIRLHLTEEARLNAIQQQAITATKNTLVLAAELRNSLDNEAASRTALAARNAELERENTDDKQRIQSITNDLTIARRSSAKVAAGSSPLAASIRHVQRGELGVNIIIDISNPPTTQHTAASFLLLHGSQLYVRALFLDVGQTVVAIDIPEQDQSGWTIGNAILINPRP